jgi:hypothetical protein
MVRLLMDDVTLIKAADGLTAHVRFRGGATTTLTLARALNAWELRETSAEILAGAETTSAIPIPTSRCWNVAL